ncbi:RluA family pseudouridine synthase [bacterium]|nr:RluA family pseudouridine synthase [bacterium]
MEETKITVSVPEGIEPIRIDLYLVSLPQVELSRSQIKHLIQEKLIVIPGKGIKPNFQLRGGESIDISIPEAVRPRLIAQDIPLDILYEDDHLLVVNKPAGMVVHPARGNWQDTLINAILYHTKIESNIGGEFRPGIVHRLDKETSGLLIVAKTEKAQHSLSYQIEKRKIERKYVALIWGTPREAAGIIDLSLGHHPRDHRKRAVIPGGKKAVTEYQVLQYYPFLTLLEVKLHTGRTHQIRVHMEHIGHPVFGDPDYGGREERLKGIAPNYRLTASELLKLIDRQALHARTIGFSHPISREFMQFESPLPQDIKAVLDSLKEI